MIKEIIININKLPNIFLILLIFSFSLLQNIYQTKSFYIFLLVSFLFFIFSLFYKTIYKIKNIDLSFIKNKILKYSIFLIFGLTVNFIYKNKIAKFKGNLKSDFKEILKSKYFYGLIFNKEFKENKFHYSIKVKNKNLKNKSLIKILTKKDLNLGSYVKIEKVFWLNSDNKNLFESFLKTKTILIGVTNNISILNKNENLIFNKIINFFENLKIKIEKGFKGNFSENENEIISSIFLGKNNFLDSNPRENFKKWGIIHYLSRSGLHATIISFFAFFISIFLFSNYIFANIVSIFFLIFFYLTTYSSISFKRAILMSIIFIICRIRFINTKIIYIYSFSTILFLIYDPFLIANIGFQLSFFITGILSIINFY